MHAMAGQVPRGFRFSGWSNFLTDLAAKQVTYVAIYFV